MDYILAFGSPHRALKAERVLKEAKVPFRLIPAPRALEALCDIVITVKGEELERAVEAIKGAGMGLKALYRKEGEGYVKV